jgi:MFS family permease
MNPRTDVRPAYVAIATVGYVVYGLGAVGPYLRERLALSDTQVGLHSTAMAIGLIIAGLSAAWAGARFGERRVRAAALAVLAASVMLLAWAPTLMATLSAGLGIGLGAGTVLGYANASMATAGGSAARVALGRANVWAMVAAFAGPILLAVGASSGIGWAIGLVPALVLIGIDLFDVHAGPELAIDDPAATQRLPGAFWLTWIYLVAVIAVEFCIVFWATTLLQRRTTSSVEAASVAAAAFFVGMFIGRLGLSVGIGTTGDVRRPAGLGLALALCGAVAVWVSTVPVISAAGLFVAGIGVAVLYPVGVAAALAVAPGQLAAAGARLTLASGMAVLVAPLALGAVADLTGVVTGWGLVLALAILGLIISRRLPSSSAGIAPVPAAPTDRRPGDSPGRGSGSEPRSRTPG